MASSTEPKTETLTPDEPKSDAPQPDEEPKLLTLSSSDGHLFSITSSAAIKSILIKNMVDECCADGVLKIGNVDAETLVKVVMYLNKHDEKDVTADERTKFAKELVEGEEMRGLFDLILAANFMDIRDLLDLVAQGIADRMKDESPEWVRETFGITNDFTPEEEEKVRSENAWAYEEGNKKNSIH